MFDRLRDAWANKILAVDYDAHMAAVGQAQANASLAAELFETAPPDPGARILFAGAGTGQMFEFVSPSILSGYAVTFADINPRFLAVLTSRLEKVEGLTFQTVVDDIEDSRLAPGFDLAVAVLVLEHVDWRRGVATLCRLAKRVFVVVQENPPELTTALSRPVSGSMAIFREVHPTLIPKTDLEREFARLGFALKHHRVREVADKKKMIALEFARCV